MIVTMKKYILAMLLGCLFLASCNETDCSYLNEFKLVESTTNYSAKACSGYILYDGGQGDAVVTATSSEEWCKVSADASKVYISLDDNTSIDSRTAMVTLTCGNQTKRVPVTQLGCITEFSKDSVYTSAFNKAMSIDYKARNTFGLEITGLPEWVSYTLTEDGIHFDVQANKTGVGRRGSAVIKALNVGKTQTVDFVQYSIDDLGGKWVSLSYNLIEDRNDTLIVDVDINKADSTVTITGLCDTDFGRIPVVGKLTKDGSYEFVGCTTIASIGGVYDVVQYSLTSTGTLYTKANYTQKCIFNYFKDYQACYFVDNNGVEGVEIAGLIVRLVDPSTGKSKGNLAAFTDLVLIR